MNIFAILKTKISILDVITQYTTLKKAGLYWKGRCPFHNEKTASFTVSPHIDIFYCFGCHETGDIIAFIAKVEHCSPMEAAHHLAERYHIELPSFDTQQTGTHFDQKNMYTKVCHQFAQWCHAQLLNNTSVMHVVTNRGFHNATMNTFLLGYFPGGVSSIKSLLFEMKNNNILAQDLIDAQILGQGKTVLFSPFEDRIIFPIHDLLGKICGFGGRIFKQEDTRAKYCNTRENDFFLKGSILFGLDKAKKTVQETGEVYLVEGYTDCIAMVQHGYTNTVATLGTACTLAHLQLIARYAHRLFIMYDSDNAGKQAILRLAELCWQVNIDLLVIMLPSGQDPASFLATNNSLKPYIDGAQDIFLFFIQSAGTSFATKSLQQKMNILKNLLTTIQSISDPLKQDLLLQKVSEYLDIQVSVLKNELNRLEKNKHHLVFDKKFPPTPILSDIQKETEKFSKLEKKIFSCLFNNVQLLNKKEFSIIIDYLPSTLRILLLQLKQVGTAHEGVIDFVSFFDSLQDKEKKWISSVLLENQECVDDNTFSELIMQLRKKWWKTITQNIKFSIEQAKREGNKDRVQELLDNFVTLQKNMMKNLSKIDI